MESKKWTPEEKQVVYKNFLSKLEFWAHSYLKMSLVADKPSKVVEYYEFMKYDKDYEFPKNADLENYIRRSEDNYKLNK